MFTGIIETKGKIKSLHPSGSSLQIHLETGFPDLAEGESVAVNGVCLTVTRPTPQGECIFFLSPETLDKSNLGPIAIGDFLNLERALTLQTRLSGHWVQGHVDGKAQWLSALPVQDHVHAQVHANDPCYDVRFLISKNLARYCVEKGSICLNGVSLTLNTITELEGDGGSIIQVTIIPHTWSQTNLSKLKQGDTVNVEVDILAKYVERLCRN